MMNVYDLAIHRVVLKKVSTGKNGPEYQGPCPGCGGKDRFHVWPEQNDGAGSYWCRQCEKWGDNIQFLIDFDGLTFKAACEKLGRKITDSRNLHTPKERGRQQWKPNKYDAPPDLWCEHALKFVNWAHERLLNDPELEGSIKWLEGRGIPPEAFKRFHLGWCSDKRGGDLYREREAWGLAEIKNEKGKAKKLWLPKGIVIPYFKGNELRRVKIRRPDPIKFGERYYVVPGSSMETCVFGAENNVFVVTEAELCAIAVCNVLGNIAGAIPLGSVSTRPDQGTTKMLKGSGCILNALDFDGPGAKEWYWWKKNFPDCIRWPVPKGKDPGEAFGLGIDLRDWVIAGLPDGLRSMIVKDGEKEISSRRGAETQRKEIPKIVYQLYELIKGKPISIKKITDDDLPGLVSNEPWILRFKDQWDAKNPEIGKRIKVAVFMNKEIKQYLMAHPERIITGENLVF